MFEDHAMNTSLGLQDDMALSVVTRIPTALAAIKPCRSAGQPTSAENWANAVICEVRQDGSIVTNFGLLGSSQTGGIKDFHAKVDYPQKTERRDLQAGTAVVDDNANCSISLG